MKRIFGVIAVTLLLSASAQAVQSNPCLSGSGTNCTTASGPPLAMTPSDAELPCAVVGENFSVTVEPTLGLAGLKQIAITNEDCVVTITNYPLPNSSIISNWWTVTGSPFTGWGTGFTSTFAPSNYGSGTLTFHLQYSEYCGGTNTVSQSFSYKVISVASLAPTNNTNCSLFSSNATEQIWTIPVSTNGAVSNLEIVATPYPSGALPACWSLNGAVANITYIGITNPGVYTVICTVGVSAMTNIIWVMENGDVEQGCPTNGPGLLGYWSFNPPGDSLVDWWPADGDSNSVVHDVIGTNNGTFDATSISYATGYSGQGFDFYGYNSSSIQFNTNVGNFGTNNFTIDFWIESTASPAINAPLLTKQPPCDDNSGTWLIVLAPNGQIGVQACGSNNAYNATFYSTATINDGLFHEVTLQRKGLTWTLYIDGNLSHTTTTTGIANLQNNSSLIAANWSCYVGMEGSEGYFAGVLDEIKFYDSAVDSWLDSVGPWLGNEGQQPLADYGLQNPDSPWGNALQVDTNASANLSYRYMEDNGPANINCINGAVSFWFKPDWNGGAGPGNPGRLLEMGDTNSTNGWWSLGVNSNGSSLSFQSKSNGVLTTYFTQSIMSWSSNEWYQVVLNYSPSQTSLYTNGVVAQTNIGIVSYPTISNRMEYGFSVGSDHNGTNQVRGRIDELYTFSCPLTATEVVTGFSGYPGYDGWEISAQPQSTNVVQGQNATFSVTASGIPGIGSFSYQWLSNGASITGANGSTYTKLAVQTNDAANYSVVVSNAGISQTSSNAALMVTIPLAITNGPAGQTVIQGANVSFSVGVSGNYLVYQWFSNGVTLNNGSGITGATTSTVTLSSVVSSEAANYTVVVTNLFGSVTSSPVTLTVITNPVITSSPSNTTTIQADDVTFSVTTAANVGLSYQWWFTNGMQTNSIPGATNSSYTQLVVQTNNAGYYSVIITNLAGGTNASADLTVLVPPWIVQQPVSIVTNQGSNATFSVSATGTTNLSYQWFENGTNAIAGATSSSLSLTNVQASNAAGYSVLVSNSAGTNFSAWAWLSVILTGGGGTTNGWGGGANPPSSVPTVSMIGPTNSFATNPAVFLYGPPISIRASASSLYSYITNVVFYYTGTNGSTSFTVAGTAVPGANTMFALAWTNAFPGTNIVKARAWDYNGNTNDSQLVYVIMAVPPAISAGSDTTIVWTEGASGTNISLSGSVSNDGQPNCQVTNIHWSVASGNGAYATISNANSLTPQVTFTTNGVFRLQLQVDNSFATNTQTCTVTINRRPRIYFNAPTNNSIFLTNTPVVLNVTASAYNVNGTIASVHFYNGAGLTNIGAGIQSVNNSYTIAWHNALNGTNLISAIATDNDGLMSTSTVSIAMLPPLTVQFVSPTNGQLFVYSPTNIFLTASAVTYFGSTVSSVVFSNQFMNLGTGVPLTNSEYQALWQEASNGNYTLSVTATDNGGNVATNSVAITINAMPVISITAPTNLQAFSQGTNGTNITITATASDSDGTITNVQFFGYNLINILGSNTTSSASVTCNVTWSNLITGNYPVVAVATDNRGATTMSAIKVFTVNPTNPPPIVQIIYPTNGSVFVPDSDITITATATNATNGGTVTNVEFYVNETDIGGASTPPYSITKCCWKPGTYIISALATDNLGMSAATNIQITITSDSPTAEGFWDAQFGLLPTSFFTSNALVYLDSTGRTASDVAVDPSGNVYALSLYSVYNLSGTNWLPMNQPPFTMPTEEGWEGIWWEGTNVYVAGVPGFSRSGSFSSAYSFFTWNWNNSQWQPVGDGLSAEVHIVTGVANIAGHLYVVGTFLSSLHLPGITGGNTNVQLIAELDAVSNVWMPVGNGITNGEIDAIAGLGNEIYIGGTFTNAGGNSNANYIARLVGNSWTNVGAGISLSDTNFDYPYPITTLVACGTNLFVGGEFTCAGGDTNAQGIAVWNTVRWQTMNGGPGAYFSDGFDFPVPDYPLPPPFHISTISARGNRVFVGGSFTNVYTGTNSIPANYIAMANWSESEQSWTWSDLDYGVGDSSGLNWVTCSAIVNGVSPDTYDLYVSGRFATAGSAQLPSGVYNVNGIARWRVGYPPPATVPKVTITPSSTLQFYTNSPTNITLVGVAVSGYTNITSAHFYTNGTEVGSPSNRLASDVTNVFGFTNQWVNPPDGLYLITAVATDSSNLTGQSQPLLIDIKSTNNPITATDDYYTIPVGTLGTNLQVLANDRSSNGPLKISQLAILHADLGTVAISFDRSYLMFTPFPNVYGTDIFFYTVTNSSGNVDSATVTLNILAPPQVTITNPADLQVISNLTAPVKITGTSSATGAGNAITNINLFIYSTNTVTNMSEVLFNGGAFSNNWTNSKPGWYTFVAVASDTNGSTNVSAPVRVLLVNTNAQADMLTASITNLVPAFVSEGDFVEQVDPVITNGVFDLRGQASGSIPTNLVSYKVLLYQAFPDIDSATTNVILQAGIYASAPPFADVTPGPLNSLGFHIGGDSNGDLGAINLTGVPNGVYAIILQVEAGDATTNALAEVQLNSQLKIGQFSFSQQDLILPVSGIPITITRTYNSMNPGSGDFGSNWTFALSSMNVQLDEQRQDVTLGSDQAPYADDESSDNGLPKVVSIRTGGGRDVTLTLPNGKTAMFQCIFQTDDLGNYTLSWRTPAGINYTLTDPHNDYYCGLTGSWNNTSGFVGAFAFDNFDIPSFLLTDNTTGVQYKITRGTGNDVVFNPDGINVDAQVYGSPTLTEIDQPSGDKIVLSSNSISHFAPGASSASRSVTIARDGLGRIIAVYDPNGAGSGLPQVQYVYNQDTGNLIQVLKLVDGTAGAYTTNWYDYNNPQFPHYITSMENGDGVTVTRNYYDATGKLIAVEDANGNFTQFIHNLTNNTEVVIDPLNNTNAYLYDLNGNVLAQTNALGQVTTMAYDGNNNKTSQVAYLNGMPYATSSYAYDQTLNLPTNSTNPLGYVSRFAYNQYGGVLTSTDARNNTTVNSYDSYGNLASTLDALGHTTSYSYSGGMLSGSTDPIGTSTANFYDGSQNLVGTSTSDTNGQILSTNTFTYDLNGNRLTSTVWRHVGGSWASATTTCVYDSQNRVIQTVDPDGGTNTVVYDGAGRQVITMDTLGRSTSYTYDFLGRLVQTMYPDTNTETSAYDANGNRTNSVDRLGRVTSYFYDALNRLTNTIYPDSTSNTTVYDGVGRVAQTMDALGTVTGFAYDVAGERLAVTNAVGVSGIQSVSTYSYDPNGNQITFTDGLGHTMTNVFDALNRQIEVLFPDGTATLTGYDADGRSVAQTNQDNLVTRFGYDGAGRLISVTNALLQVTRYQYDEAGNQTNQIDALNRTNVYYYDGMGRRVKHVMPGSQSEGMAYDLAGNLTYQTNFNSAVITNQYDVMNRLTNQASVHGYSAGYTYTATGQRSAMVDVSGTTTNSYDNRDRLLVKAVHWSGGPSVSLYYGYDANGNVTNIGSSTANGVTNQYQYDALSRLTNVLANGSAAAAYGFDLSGNLQTMRYGNGVTNQYQYDRLNRLTNAVWKLNASTLASFYYHLGLTGNRTNAVETVNGGGRTNVWQYDPLYRLTNENVIALGTNGYWYDAVGNRTNRITSIAGLTNQTNIYNPNDWLTNTDSYDSNGNTTGSSTNIYAYDALNHMTNANSGGVLITYDGDGNRTSKTVSGTATYYLSDDRNPSGYTQVLEEYQGSTLSRVYNYGLGLVSQRQVPSGTVSYYGCDGHGNVRFLTSLTGGITDTNTYDAYGNLIATNGTTPNNYLYCCQQFDWALGLSVNRVRLLNLNIGRFLTMDTYEGDQSDPLSLHKYLYCDANPVNMTDPSGQDGDVGEFAVVETGVAGIASFSAGATATATTAAEVSLTKSTAEVLLLTAGIIGTTFSQDLIPQNQYVVRGGLATIQQLQAGTKEHNAIPGLTGFSVESAPGKSVPELARGGKFKNLQISVSTVGALNSAANIAGYTISIIPTPSVRSENHCTVKTPAPLPTPLAAVLSAAFVPQPNPYPVR